MKSKSTCANRTRRLFGSSPCGGAPAIRALTLLDAAAVPDEAVEAPRIDIGPQLARLPDHRLAGAEHEPTVFRHARGEPLEGERLLLGAEVEEDIAAEDD